jgi:hypothetical protein
MSHDEETGFGSHDHSFTFIKISSYRANGVYEIKWISGFYG